MRTKDTHAAPTIVEAAPEGDGGGGPDQAAGNTIQSKRREGVAQHPGAGGEELQERTDLSPDTGRETALRSDSQGDGGGRQDEQVAAEDDDYEPPRDGM